MKVVYVSVINDLSYDQRVHKVCTLLHEMQFKVVLIGRKLPSSIPIQRDYTTKRIRMVFKKGPLFYAFFNIRLFFILLFSKAAILHANDLDTLLPNYLVSKLKKLPLVYDSHEYFTGVPELQARPTIQKIWETIEKKIFPKLKHVFTVNQSIAKLYEEHYGVAVKVLRNIPSSIPIPKILERQDLGLPQKVPIVILQGAGINIDRGAEELLEAVALMDNIFLVIAGSGDVIDTLKSRCKNDDLRNKVLFTGKLPYNDMMQYTMNANLGVSLDKPKSINYELSLPNKLFDYIKANIPVLSSDLVELKNVIEKFEIGAIIKTHNPLSIKKGIEELLNDEVRYNAMVAKTKIAARQLSWENEVFELRKCYNDLK